MRLAALYDALNRLFGVPAAVSSETGCERAQALFNEGGRAFMEQISTYISADSRILVVGCGEGAGEIEWFASRCKSVVAVDVARRAVDRSANRTAALTNVRCQLVDGRTLGFRDREFDLVFMRNVCEHIINVKECFDEYYRVLKPGGILVNKFAPLFYSPYGAHFQDALKLPWGHLIFGLGPVVELRNKYYPGQLAASSWTDLGLNRITERRYRTIVTSAGFRNRIYTIQTSRNMPLVAYIPLIRNLFIFGVINILERPAEPSGS